MRQDKTPRIIFVGIHNKGTLPPLFRSTKTGKLIDRIIKYFNGNRSVKTNLYDLPGLPDKSMKHDHAVLWHYRIKPKPLDVIVLLSKEVENNFLAGPQIKRIIKLHHPASIYGEVSEQVYISTAVILIDKMLKT